MLRHAVGRSRDCPGEPPDSRHCFACDRPSSNGRIVRRRPEPGRYLWTIGGWTGIRCGFTDHHKSGYLGTVDHSPLDYGPVDYHGGPPAHG